MFQDHTHTHTHMHTHMIVFCYNETLLNDGYTIVGFPLLQLPAINGFTFIINLGSRRLFGMQDKCQA